MNKQIKGFTLIELLVVVGIIAVLAIAALIAINPLEAQRRARDSARLQDMARLQGVLEAYINDEGITDIADGAQHTGGLGSIRNQDCANNWLGVDVCAYLKQVPLDPRNSVDISAVDQNGDRFAATAAYGLNYQQATGQYVFCTWLEADSSVETIAGNGGTANQFDTGTISGLAGCTLPTP